MHKANAGTQSLGIRIHGRGGQGAVLASKILAWAYFLEGMYVQAFPAFGMERRGAPVAAYVRVDKRPALARGKIASPDVSVVLDSKLLEMVDVIKGLSRDAVLVLNHPGREKAPEFKGVASLAVVDATMIALAHGLGSPLAPIVNTVILGAYVKAVQDPPLSWANLTRAIAESIPGNKDENVAAAWEAYNKVTILEKNLWQRE